MTRLPRVIGRPVSALNRGGHRLQSPAHRVADESKEEKGKRRKEEEKKKRGQIYFLAFSAAGRAE